MREFEKQGGISFMIIYYTNRNEMYYLPFYLVEKFYLRSAAGGRKSFRFEEIDLQYQINTDKGVPVHYLETLAIDLQNRD